MINSLKFIAQEISEVADAFLNSDLQWEEMKILAILIKWMHH